MHTAAILLNVVDKNRFLPISRQLFITYVSAINILMNSS